MPISIFQNCWLNVKLMSNLDSFLYWSNLKVLQIGWPMYKHDFINTVTARD